MSSSPRPWKVVESYHAGSTDSYPKIVDANGLDVFFCQYPSSEIGSYVTAHGDDLQLIVDAVNTRALAAGETYPNSKIAQEGMIVAEELAKNGDEFGAEVVKKLALLAESWLMPHGSGLEHARSDFANAATYAMHSSLGHTFSVIDLKCTKCGLYERDMLLNPRPCEAERLQQQLAQPPRYESIRGIRVNVNDWLPSDRAILDNDRIQVSRETYVKIQAANGDNELRQAFDGVNIHVLDQDLRGFTKVFPRNFGKMVP